mgnify:CR=1 FL=1
MFKPVSVQEAHPAEGHVSLDNSEGEDPVLARASQGSSWHVALVL